MLFVKCRLTARFFHYEWHILLSVRTRKGIPVITFKIQERHAMMYIDNEVLEKMIMTIVEGFDRMEKKLDSMMRVKDCMDGDKLLDNYDLARLLGVSLRTVARYREKGLIRYYQTDENELLSQFGCAGVPATAREEKIENVLFHNEEVMLTLHLKYML